MSTTFDFRGIHFRTRLLTEPRAASVRAMLLGSGRFRDVEALVAPTAKPPRCWYVSYASADAARQEELRRLFQAEQDERAESQWPDYVVTSTNYASLYDVRRIETGQEYRTTLGAEPACTCADHIYRRNREPGACCKHVRIVKIHGELDLVRPHAPHAPTLNAPTLNAPNPIPEHACRRCGREVVRNTLARIAQMEGWGWQDRPAYRFAQDDLERYRQYLRDDVKAHGPCPSCGEKEIP